MWFPPSKSDIDYFAQRVQLDEITGCWNWIGSKWSSGYGRAYMPQFFGRMGAHKLAFILFVGPVPDGKELHHKCRNPGCANPFHLEPKTRQEHSVIHLSTSECPRGHVYVQGGFYVVVRNNGSRFRMCKQCTKDRAKARYYANKELRKSQMMAYRIARKSRKTVTV